MKRYYFETTENVLHSLGSSMDGLRSTFAAQRLGEEGKNQLDRSAGPAVLSAFLKRLADPSAVVLLAGSLAFFYLREYIAAGVLFASVLLGAVLAVRREERPFISSKPLQQMIPPSAQVRRDGAVKQIRSSELVRGDIVLLDPGDCVPADLRLIRASGLCLDQSPLTGEPSPVLKNSFVLPDRGKSIPLSDRTNIAYMGSVVLSGQGEGIVIHKGMETELGRTAGQISSDIEETEALPDGGARTGSNKTTLQAQLSGLSKIEFLWLAIVCLLYSAVSFAVHGPGNADSILGTVATLAAAGLPEGLAFVITLLLAIGAKHLRAHGVLVRRLDAAAALGYTQVVIADQSAVFVQNDTKVAFITGHPDRLATALCLCSDAVLSPEGDSVSGSPAEAAQVIFALENGQDQNKLRAVMPRVGQAPYDATRRLMSTVHKRPTGLHVQYTKGAPYNILRACSHYEEKNDVLPFSVEKRDELLQQWEDLEHKGLAVLGVAIKSYTAPPETFDPDALEFGMIFLGFVGMSFPARPETAEAIETCFRSGIRPVLFSDASVQTAAALAKTNRIIRNAGEVMAGSRLNDMLDVELEESIDEYGVFVQASPEQKARAVRAWKHRGAAVAVTGSSLSEAPALREADTGIGLGAEGNAVIKSAADVLLTDNSFASAVSAVLESRKVIDCIRKASALLLAQSFGMVLYILIAAFFGLALPSPQQVLWINLLTVALPAVLAGISALRDGAQTLQDAPDGHLLPAGAAAGLLCQGGLFAVASFLSYRIGEGLPAGAGSVMAFVTLSFCGIFGIMNINFTFALPVSVLLSGLLTAAAVYIPAISGALSLTALPLSEFLYACGLSFAAVPVVALIRFLSRRPANPPDSNIQ